MTLILIEDVLLFFLIVAAVAICVIPRLLAAMIIYTSYGVIMSVLWIMLSAPDLAITEAAVGTGISSILFFVVLKQIRVMEIEHREEKEWKKKNEGQ